MRHLTIAIITGALCLSCGGGGGAPAGGGGGGGGGGLTGAALAESILNDCGADAILRLVAILNAMNAVLDPAGVNPAFTVTAITQPNTINWTLDLDRDGTADFEGAFSFFDETGAPGAPFDLNQFVTGLANLDAQITAMADGSQLRIDVVGINGSTESGGLGLLFNSGTPIQLDGLINAIVGNCSGTFEMLATPITAFTVTGDISTTIDSADGSLSGGTTLDGSNTATVTVTVDGGGAEFVFLIDLTTGAVTQAP